MVRRKGILEDEVDVLAAKTGEAEFHDSITGQPLDGSLGRAARKEELEYFASKNVWRKAPRAEALQKQGEPPQSSGWT